MTFGLLLAGCGTLYVLCVCWREGMNDLSSAINHRQQQQQGEGMDVWKHIRFVFCQWIVESTQRDRTTQIFECTSCFVATKDKQSVQRRKREQREKCLLVFHWHTVLGISVPPPPQWTHPKGQRSILIVGNAHSPGVQSSHPGEPFIFFF